MSKRNDISFIRTPVEFLRLGITSAAELVVVSLAFAFKDKGLRMSNNQLAVLLSTDRRHIPRLVHRLIGKGLLESAIENGCRILRFTDTKVVPPPDTKVVTRGHQSGDKVTPLRPPPSKTEVTEVTEIRAQQPSPSEAGGGKRKPKGKTTSRPAFIAPTIDQVRAYAESRGHSDFDADYFVEHYTTADWHDVAGNEVRNWKGKVLTWIKRDEERRKASGQPQRNELNLDGSTEEEILAALG